MAKEALHSALRLLGCAVSDTMIYFSPRFIVDDLRHSFGVFTFDGEEATYRMIPLTECGKYGQDDPAFFEDIQTAINRVREGQGFAIVLVCQVDDDAYTKLVYMPWSLHATEN